MRLGTVIRKWRINSELPLRDASALIGISAATLMRIESGRVVDGRTMTKLMIWLFSEEKRVKS